MKKAQAIEMLGGTVGAAAKAVGVSSSAVSQWPDELPRRIEDRVLAALARRLSAPPPKAPADAPTAVGEFRRRRDEQTSDPMPPRPAGPAAGSRRREHSS